MMFGRLEKMQSIGAPQIYTSFVKTWRVQADAAIEEDASAHKKQ
jgi:hypothetical protein